MRFSLKRAIIQAAASLCQNPFLQNLWLGTIYKGPAKVVCSPGLNCWSCPAAAASCPIGALQSLAATTQYSVSFYVLGLLLIVGVLVGRLVCGFLCIFGFLQDLLYAIPTPKITVPAWLDHPLRWLKYAVLLVLVLLLPALVNNEFDVGQSFFCEYLCPSGTIGAGFPLLIADERLRDLIGPLFTWKTLVALLVVVSAVFIKRPFCKYLCPLGALYGILNRFSFVRLRVRPSACVHCGACERACPMGVAVTKKLETSAECIRCGACKHVCPVQAITWCGLRLQQNAVMHDSARTQGRSPRT